MLRWAADITAQRDQRSQHAGRPAPAAEDTARVQANRADVAASEAYKAGDLDRAEELTEQAAALDPSRAGLWQQHRNDIAARRLITAARAAHADADHERAGKLLQDARKLDPRLRTLWDGGLPAQPATQPGRPAPDLAAPPRKRTAPAVSDARRPPRSQARGHRSRHGRPRRPGATQTVPPPRRGGPPGRSQQRSVLLAAQVRVNHGQRHRPARRTLTRMRAMTPPAGRHPAPAARATARPLAADRERRAVSQAPAEGDLTRARQEQAPGHRRTGGTRFSAGPACRAARPELAAPPCHPPDPGNRRRRARNRARPVTRRRGSQLASRCSGRTGGSRTRGCSRNRCSGSRKPRLRRTRHRGGPVGFGSGNGQPSPARSRTCCRGSVTSREPPTVNQYGEMARRHWARWLPTGWRRSGIRKRSSPAWGTRRGEDHRAGLGTGGGRPAGRPYLGKAGGSGRHGTGPSRSCCTR